VPVDGVLVPGVVLYESRLAFAGRTGQYTASHDIDNVVGEFRGPLDLGPAGVLTNDVGVDVLSSALSAFVIEPPRFGTLQFNTDGRFSYQPNTGFTGVDEFAYRATDGQPFSDPTTVRIVVAPPGKLPHDLNADGAVNASDVAFLMAGYGRASAAKSIEGDLDGDGRIGIRDAIGLPNAVTASPSPAAALTAQVHDRVIMQTADEAALLRARRKMRRTVHDFSQAGPEAIDHAVSAVVENPYLLAGRRSRLLARTRR
jgi:hypothetical protein